MAPRIPLVNTEPMEIGLADPSGLCPELDELRRGAPTGVHEGALDPVTAELVRLRNARHQGCNICQSLRYADAVAAGATEDVLADGYPGRTATQAAALRVADAFLTAPATLTAHDRTELLADLTPDELVEVVGRLANWTYNKVLIALGLDVERIERRVYPGGGRARG